MDTHSILTVGRGPPGPPDAARAELEAWRADPHALSLQANYLAIGRVD